jgi:hypothetical protein
MGDIQDVVAGSGLTGGGSSGAVTLSVDTGTTNGKIVAMGAGDKLPAVDGSNLTNLNAIKIQSRDVAATAPNASEVLMWNNSTSVWEPKAIPSAPVSSVATKTGAVTLDWSDILNAAGKYFGYKPNNAACADGEVLKWNNSASYWECGTDLDSGGDVQSVSAGTGATGGGVSGAVTIGVDVGTTTGKIVQMAASDKLPAVDGSNLTFINAVKLQTRDVAATAPNAGEILKWNNSTSAWEPSADIDTGITQLTGDVTAGPGSGSQAATIANDKITSAKINSTGIGVNRLLITDASTGANVTYATCAVGEILKWTAFGWACASDIGGSGFVTHVGSGTGLLGGPITSTGTLSVDVGTTTGQIVQVAAANKLPVIDGSNLTNINAVQLQSKNISATAPTANQVLKWNNGTSVWEPAADTDTTTTIVAGTGLTGGVITANGTLAVDVGATNGKIVQVGASDRLPAIDGRNLTFINAVQLQSRDVSSAAPAADQVLTWNGTTSVWESRALPAGNIGDVTSVVASTGLTGGGASGDLTISVDVGTTAGKIVQMAAGDKLPAVDGSNLTNLNVAGSNGYVQNGNSFGAAANLGTNDNFALNFKTNNSTKMTIDTSGYVGIGTTSPISALDVRAGAITQYTVVTDSQLSAGILATDTSLSLVDASTYPNSGMLYVTDGSTTEVLSYASKSGNNLNGLSRGLMGTAAVAAPINKTVHYVRMGLGNGNGKGAFVFSSGAALFGNAEGNYDPGVSSLTVGNASRANGAYSVALGSVARATGDKSMAFGDTVWSKAENSQSFGEEITNNSYDSLAIGRGNVGGGTNASWVTTDPIFEIGIGTSGTPANAMTVLKNGNVGIGTTNPGVKLDVAGVMRVTDICDEAGANCKDISSGWGGGGDIDGVYSGTGLTGGFASGSGTLSVDVGTTAGQIVQVAAGNKLPVIDGSNLTGVNAVQIQGKNISATAPTANQVLKWNNGTSVWEAAAETDVYNGTVTSVVSGSGLTGGNITSTGTLAVDVGTTAGKIVQMAAGDKLPAVDGSNLTNLNLSGSSGFVQNGNSFGAAATLGTNDNFALNFETNNATRMTLDISGNFGIGSTAPASKLDVAGQLTLGTSGTAGSIDLRRSSDGATTASITNYGTEFRMQNTSGSGYFSFFTNNGSTTEKVRIDNAGNVGIGTTNPAVKLDVAGVMRVTDICDETGANCKDISAGWGGGGDIDGVYSGTGLTGGFASGSGTLAVDVGTVAGKIVQMAAGDKLPAVDGSNLTQVNAVKLQSKSVSATAPTANQVLMWNNGTSVWEPQPVSAGGSFFAQNGNSFGAAANLGTNDNFALNFKTNNSTAMTIATSGNVGIGTNNPSRNFHVESNGGTSVGVMLNNTAAGGRSYSFFSTNNTSGLGGGKFGIYDDTAGQARLVLDSNGYVGLGSSAPTQALDVVGNVKASSTTSSVNFVASTSFNGALAQLQLNNTGTGGANWALGAGNNTTGVLGNAFGLAEGANYRMVVAQGGNVGIGTLAPASGLHLNSGDTSRLTLQHIDSTTGYSEIAYRDSANLKWEAGVYSDSYSTATRQNGYYIFQARDKADTAVNAFRLFINDNGDVGIGTTAPAAKLDVSGVIRATDICDETGANCKDISSGWGAGGDIDGVYTGTGLTGGFASGSGTLAVDVGTAAGKIVQVAAGNKLPVIDGSNLTGVNAVQLQGKNISATAPTTTGHVLTWNNGNSTWESTANPGTNSFVQNGNSFGGAAVLGTNDNNTLGFETNNTTRMTIDTSGNVGIGTASPGYLVHARKDQNSGTNYAVENQSAGASANVGFTAISNSGNVNFGINSVANGGNAYIWNTANTSIEFGTNSTARMAISNSGNVGIGTTNASQALVVERDGGASISLRSYDDSNPSYIFFNRARGTRASPTALVAGSQIMGLDSYGWDGSSLAYTGGIYLNAEEAFTGSARGSRLSFLVTPNGTTSSITAMRIINSGNVGIGTINPAAKLDVAGVIRATDICDETGANCKDISSGWGAGGDIDGVYTGTGLSGGFASGSGTLAVDVGTTTGKIVQVAASNKLPVIDGSNLTGVIASSVAAGAGTVGAPSISFSGDPNTGWWNPAADILAASTNGFERVRIDNNGRMNIGSTNAAAYRLEVNGSDNSDLKVRVWNDNSTTAQYPGFVAQNFIGTAGNGAPQVYLANSRGGNGTPSPIQSGDILGFLTFAGTYSGYNNYTAAEIRGAASQTFATGAGGGNLQFSTASIGTNVMAERMRITDSGNVGIGTTNPATKLDVNGTITATGFSGPLSTSVGTFGLGTVGAPSITFTGDTNTGWWSPGADTLAASTNGAERVRIDSTGYMGVGTNNPQTNIHIYHASVIPKIRMGYNSTTSYSEFQEAATDQLLINQVTAAGSPQIDLNPVPSNGTGNSAVRLFRDVTTTGAKTLEIKRGDGTNTTDAQIASGTTVSYFGMGGGNVGIGTSSPTVLLDVQDTGPYGSPQWKSYIGVTGPADNYPGLFATAFGGTVAAESAVISGKRTRGTMAARTSTAAGDMILNINGRGWNSTLSNYSGGQILFSQSGAATATGNPVDIGFFSNDGTTAYGTERLRITGSGNVGIGTTNPASKLDVAGIIRATDICDETGANCKDISAGWGSGGSVTSVVGGTGLMGGNITSAGTLAVDVGTAVSKIPQLATGGALNLALGSASAPTYSFSGDANTGVFSSAADFLDFTTAGTEAMRIDNLGNIGMGQTGTVQNSVHIHRAGANWNYLQLTNGTTGNTTNSMGLKVGIEADGTANLSSSMNMPLQFSTSNNVRMAISGSGNVGIGTTSPNAQLELKANSASLMLTDANSSFGTNISTSIAFKDNVNVDIGTIGWLGTRDMYLRNYDQGIIFNTANTDRMRLDASGNLGIGTLSPGAPLHIYSGTTNAVMRIQGTGDGSDFATIKLISDEATDKQWHISHRQATLNSLFFNFHDGTSWSTPMAIGSNGNVGIGTTNPATKLEVNGTITATGFSGPFSTSVGTFGAGTVGAPSITFTGDTNTGWWSPAADTIAASTGGLERIRLDSSGRLGIGTNSPYNDLEVNRTNADASIRVMNMGGATVRYPAVMVQNYIDTSGGGWPEFYGISSRGTQGTPAVTQSGDTLAVFGGKGTWDTSYNTRMSASVSFHASETAGASGSGGNIHFNTINNGTTSWTEKMRITDTGNVGIGTTGPNDKLEVAGNIRTASNGYFYASNTGISQVLLNSTGSNWGTLQNDAADKWSLGYRNSAASTLGTPVLTWNASGNVGIGTTGPQYNLHIDGAAQGAATSLGMMNNSSGHGGSDGLVFGLANDNSSTWIWNYENSPLRIATNNVERMRIDSSGNVGIGTTNPATKLDVNGTITATGFSGPLSTSVGTFGLGTVGAPSITFTGDTNTGWWSPAADTLAASTNGVERMRIDSSGNIGIGTNSATFPLDIRKTFSAAAWNQGGWMWNYISGAGAANNYGATMEFVTENAVTGAFNNESRALQTTAKSTNDASIQKVYGVFSSIETHPNDSGYGIYVENRNNSTSTGGTQFGVFINMTDADVTNYGIYQNSANNNYFAGNVGIGTNSPAAPLNVVGQVGGGTAFFQRAGGGDGVVLGANASGVPYISGVTAGGAASNLLLNQGGGNVGIGTTSPNSLLTVEGVTALKETVAPANTANYGKLYVKSADSKLYFMDDSGVETNLTASAGTSFIQNGNSYGGAATLGTNDANILKFETNNVTRMTLDTSGQVGIGTAAPTFPLEVYGPSAASTTPYNMMTLDTRAWAVDNGGGIGFRSYIDGSNTISTHAGIRGGKENSTSGDTAGYLAFSTRASGQGHAEKMRLDSQGRLGIGTTTPSDTLQVAGNIRTSNNGYFYASNTGISQVLLNSNAGNWGTIQNDNTNIWSLGWRNSLASTLGTPVLTWNTSGNVGIGTTSPIVSLTASDNTSGIQAISAVTGAPAGTVGMFVGADASKARIIVDSYANAAAMGSFVTLRTARGTGSAATATQSGDVLGGVTVEGRAATDYGQSTPIIQGVATETYTNSANGVAIAFATTPNGSTAYAERMRIDQNGNVGIGTLTPGHKLHVIGTAGLSTGTAWTNTSDRRLKDIHGDYGYGLNEILKLHTVRFSYKKDNPLGLPSDKEIVGFVAQEVQQVIPEAVVTREDGYLELNVDPIHWASVNAIKELHGICKMSQEQLASLQAQIEDHGRRLASLESENAKKDAEIQNLKMQNAAKDRRLDALEKQNAAIKAAICQINPSAQICK